MGYLDGIARIDPELDQLLKQIGSLPDITQSDPKEIRAFAKLRANDRPKPVSSDVKTEDITIPARDGHQMPAIVYMPARPPQQGSALVVMYHGGGFVLGDPSLEDQYCRNFVQHFGVVAVNVDYRLAPEHKFPVPVNDTWDALQWVAKHATELGATHGQGFIVGGTSAGANLTDVVAHLARDEKLSPSLTGELLMIPSLVGEPKDLPEKYRARHISRTQNGDSPILGRKELRYFQQHYQPDPQSHLNRPFFWPGGHAGMPPVAFQAAGMDPLRDDALLYEEVLREAGVKTKLEVYPGMPHGGKDMFPHLKMSQKFVKDTLECMAWLLQQVKH